jgi:hypothetical protein
MDDLIVVLLIIGLEAAQQKEAFKKIATKSLCLRRSFSVGAKSQSLTKCK